MCCQFIAVDRQSRLALGNQRRSRTTEFWSADAAIRLAAGTAALLAELYLYRRLASASEDSANTWSASSRKPLMSATSQGDKGSF